MVGGSGYFPIKRHGVREMWGKSCGLDPRCERFFSLNVLCEVLEETAKAQKVLHRKSAMRKM